MQDSKIGGSPLIYDNIIKQFSSSPRHKYLRTQYKFVSDRNNREEDLEKLQAKQQSQASVSESLITERYVELEAKFSLMEHSLKTLEEKWKTLEATNSNLMKRLEESEKKIEKLNVNSLAFNMFMDGPKVPMTENNLDTNTESNDEPLPFFHQPVDSLQKLEVFEKKLNLKAPNMKFIRQLKEMVKKIKEN